MTWTYRVVLQCSSSACLLQPLPHTEPGTKNHLRVFQTSRKRPACKPRSPAIQIHISSQMSPTSQPEGLSSAPRAKCFSILNLFLHQLSDLNVPFPLLGTQTHSHFSSCSQGLHWHPQAKPKREFRSNQPAQSVSPSPGPC